MPTANLCKMDRNADLAYGPGSPWFKFIRDGQETQWQNGNGNHV